MNTPKPPTSAGRTRSLNQQTLIIGTDPNSRSRVIDAPEGTLLAAAGSPCEHVYQLVSGQLKIIIPGQADTIACGMETARLAQCEGIVDGKWVANVLAHTNVRVMKLSPRELLLLLEVVRAQTKKIDQQYFEASQAFSKSVAELKGRLNDAAESVTKAEKARADAEARLIETSAGLPRLESNGKANLREVARLCQEVDVARKKREEAESLAKKSAGEKQTLARRVADLENQLLIRREESIEGSGDRAEIDVLREEIAQRDHLLGALAGGNDRMVMLLKEIERQNQTIRKLRIETAELRAETPRLTPTVPFELDEDYAASERRTGNEDETIEVQNAWLEPRRAKFEPPELDLESMDWDELADEPTIFKTRTTQVGTPVGKPPSPKPPQDGVKEAATLFDPRTTKVGMPALKVPRPGPAPQPGRKYALPDAKNRPPRPTPIKRNE